MNSDHLVQVSIQNRTLRIGRQAYPLQGITRVEAKTYVLRRSMIVLNYVRDAGVWIVFGLVGVCVLSNVGEDASFIWLAALALLVAIMLVVRTVQFARTLALPDMHVLEVETAGNSRAAVLSADGDQIDWLADRVLEAIDNPAKEFSVTVENIFGDKILGSKILGDKIEHDKIVYGAQ